MIITREQLKAITKCDYYNGEVLHSRFAYKFFRDKTHPAGNIISFVAPMRVESEFMIDQEDLISGDFIYSEKAINFCYELPIPNLWGGVAFQRLFNCMIGDILASILLVDTDIQGDDIFINKEFIQGGVTQLRGKASVSIVCERQGAILGHTGINIVAGKEAPAFAYSTNMTDEQAVEFMKKCISVFYETIGSIFIASSKVI